MLGHAFIGLVQNKVVSAQSVGSIQLEIALLLKGLNAKPMALNHGISDILGNKNYTLP